jgi:DNA-binding transcriptional regulator YhcF (GntR family)
MGEGALKAVDKMWTQRELAERFGVTHMTVRQAYWLSPHGWAGYIHAASAHGCVIELSERYR